MNYVRALLKINANIIPGLLNGFVPSGLPDKILCAFLITIPAHLILLDLIALTIFVRYKS
jgi:hypothetical protein